MCHRAPLTLAAENEIVQAIAAMLHELRDEAWAEVALEIAFADGFSQFQTWSRTSYDGAWQATGRYAGRSQEFAGLFAELRNLMYRPGTGTWFSARVTVSDQGDYRADYDFDNEPRFDPPVAPELYVKDLEAFPRDPSRIPAWVVEPG
jgi:hypothetical protein